MTANTGIEVKGYNLLSNLEDEEDALNSFVNEYSESTYVGDAISEIGDSFIPIYTNDVWKDAENIQEYIEEAISSGLAPTDGNNLDLVRIFQAGYYQYYTQSLYDNLDSMAFNIIANKVNEYLNSVEEINLDVSAIEEAIENLTNNYDNNNRFDDLEDKANEIIGAIKEGEYTENE